MRRFLTALALGLFLCSGPLHAAPPAPYAVAGADATCQPYEGPAVTFKTGEAIALVDQIEMTLVCSTPAGLQFDCSHLIPVDGKFVVDLTDWEKTHFTPAEKAGIQCMADALTMPKGNG